MLPSSTADEQASNRSIQDEKLSASSSSGPQNGYSLKDFPSFVNYIAGVCGGVAVVLVGHPFDTTKTRMQTAPEGFYTSTLDCVKKTYHWEGARGFYSGIMSPMLGQMFFRAASFVTFFHTLNFVGKLGERTSSSSSSSPSSSLSSSPSMSQETKATPVSNIMMAGAITGFCISFIETPIDLVKTKLQIQIFNLQSGQKLMVPYNTVTGCVKAISSSHGFLGLWQGWRATAIRNIPANALFFPVNEIVKGKLAVMEGKQRIEDISMTSKLVAGASAGLCYW